MNNRQAHITRAKIIAALPASAKELNERTGYADSTIHRHISRLRYEKFVRVGDWGRPEIAGPYFPIFELSHLPDIVCKLKPTPDKIRARRLRARLKKSGEIEEHRAKLRARASADRAAYTRDPLLAAFFGAPR